MRKAVLVTAVALMVAAMLATPVLAAPTNGQKVPIAIKFTAYKTISGENRITNGNTSHPSDYMIYFHVSLSIDGAAPLVGECIDVRDGMAFRYSKVGMQVLREDAVLSFSTGTFEGNELLFMTDFTPGPPMTYHIWGHGVFHGTGAFEGQTINVWAESDVPPGGEWTGYLLKPQH